MNSIIEAQQEYFDRQSILKTAKNAPVSAQDTESQLSYLKRCDQYVFDQQRDIWDSKINSI